METSNIVLPESLTLSSLREDPITKEGRRVDLGPDGIQLDKVMAGIEKDYILEAMKMARGSKQGAAEILGINMRSLRYRLDKLGLASNQIP
jgi:two-component system response regulator PilR (NtrC family)